MSDTIGINQSNEIDLSGATKFDVDGCIIYSYLEDTYMDEFMKNLFLDLFTRLNKDIYSDFNISKLTNQSKEKGNYMNE